jgi:hypothetical protein
MKTGEGATSFVPARDACQATFRRARAHLTGSLKSFIKGLIAFFYNRCAEWTPEGPTAPRLS